MSYLLTVYVMDEEMPYKLKCKNKDQVIKSLLEWAESGGYWGMKIETIYYTKV